jgi:DNA-binding MarR family transcriptional regulator
MAERHVRGAIVNELGVASRYAHELVALELRAAGVVPSEYGFLSFIGSLQPVTRTKLTEAIGLRRTTVRDVVKRLIERGHVLEVENPKDGRSTLLVLTPEGREIWDLGQPAIKRVLEAIDERLGGKLDEHEEVVWRVRNVVQELIGDREPVPWE